ncbi:hypothetical protein Hanom_Chr11g01030401 [Helianthus anomalus]
MSSPPSPFTFTAFLNHPLHRHLRLTAQPPTFIIITNINVQQPPNTTRTNPTSIRPPQPF